MTDTQLARATVSIREMILRGRLQGGQRVAEAMLAEALGMSRTPIRQALPLLAREGLLVESGTRGYVVRTFTRSDILDAIDVRGLLEGFAARRIAERGAAPVFLAQLRECLQEGDRIFAKGHLVESDEAAYGAMNGRFHALIIEAADSSVTADAIERIASIPFAAAAAIAFDASDLDSMFDALWIAHQQHHAVFDALGTGQATRVEFLMREHVNTVKTSINMLEAGEVTIGRPAVLPVLKAAR
ncbi:MAG TPA: GntR family transcriptional regulator [Steroidobacteraceae bacterium]|nr:GntR family transcriptional regulator [Steroidobacteraceae bacterium]